MRGILKKLLCGLLVFLYAASFVMLAYTSVNAESVTEKSGNSVETDNDGDMENAEYGLSVDDYDFSEIDEIMKKFGLESVEKIIYDNSSHYRSYLDIEWKADEKR